MTGRYGLDVNGIIETFGGVNDTAAALDSVDPNGITVSAVEKYRERRMMPTQRLLDLIQFAELRGRRFDIRKFITRGKT